MLLKKNGKFNVTDFDKNVSELFYKDVKSVNIFDEFRVNDVSYATAIQSNLYEQLILEKTRMRAGSPRSLLSNIKIFARDRGLDQLYKLMVSFFKRTNHYPDSKKIIFFAENFVSHLLDDFIKVINGFERKNMILFVSNDKRSIRYIKSRLPDVEILYFGIHDINAKQFLNGLKETQILQKLLKRRKGGLKDIFHNYSSNPKKIISVFKSNFFILPFYSQILRVVIGNIKAEKFVIGTDTFSLSRVAIDLCKEFGITTYVIQHGMVQGYNGYLPLYADGVFLWSEKEKLFFQGMGFEEKKLCVTGAPRFSSLTISNATVKEKITITYISSDTQTFEIKKTIDDLEAISKSLTIPFRIIFRPHPHVKLLTKKIYNNNYFKLRNTEIDSDSQLNDILDVTDFAIVSNCSTAIFELATKKIPFCITEPKDWNDLGINLYNFKRSSITEIITKIQLFYSHPSLNEQGGENFYSNIGSQYSRDQHSSSVKNIVKHLLEE